MLPNCNFRREIPKRIMDLPYQPYHAQEMYIPKPGLPRPIGRTKKFNTKSKKQNFRIIRIYSN